MPKQSKSWWVNLLGIAGLIGLALVVGLILSQRRGVETAQGPEPTSVPLLEASPQATNPGEPFTSPLPTPQSGFPVPDDNPTPLPPSTLTPPPPPPTPEPTATFTPGPPTPTPEPLPTLLPELETLVYATTGDSYPELYRVQIDDSNQIVGSPQLINTADLWRDRTWVIDLYPSADGRRIAVAWVSGEIKTNISILDVNDGQFKPLLDEEGAIDMTQSVRFFDWEPDGNNILILAGGGNPDLGWDIWTVDVQSKQYRRIEAVENTMGPSITGASFSPDGQAIAYARVDCYQCNSTIWRTNLDSSDHQQILEVSEMRVENVLWSPRGDYIVFTQFQEANDKGLPYGYTIGELWTITSDGNEKRRISTALVGNYSWLTPVWSSDGQHIAFLLNSSDTSNNDIGFLPGNVYLANLPNEQVNQFTNLRGAVIRKPLWSPDSSKVAFLIWQNESLDQSVLSINPVDGRESNLLNLNTYKLDTIVWLSAPLSGGEK